MKRILFALAAISTLLVSCTDNGPDKGNEVLYFKAFGFYVEDNTEVKPGEPVEGEETPADEYIQMISKDYIAQGLDATSTVVNVSFPYGARIDSLVPRFSVDPGITVMYADEEVISGETALDFTNPVDFILTKEDVSGIQTVKIVFSNSDWEKIAEAVEVSTDFVMTINPKDNIPYLFTKTATKEIPDPDNPDKTINVGKRPALFKYTGGDEMANVAGNLIDYQTDYLALDFNANGIPYVVFRDDSEAGGKKLSVMKVEGSKASYVGTAGALSKPTCNSIGSVAVFPLADNNVYVSHLNNDATVVAKRAVNFAKYDGANWTNGLQLPGRDLSERSYITIGKIVKGVPYLYVLNYSKVSVSVYKYENNAWIDLFGEVKPLNANGEPITTADFQYGCHDFDVASNGDVYVACSADFAEAGKKQYGVVRVSKDNDVVKQDIIGGGVITNTDHSKARYISLALSSDDTPYFAYGNSFSNTAAGVISIDPKTKAWSAPTEVYFSKTSWINIKFAEDGTGYLSFADDNAETVVLMKKK